MIKDASLVMANAQATTVSAASTDYIDTLAAGQAYVGSIVEFRVNGAPTAAAGAPTMTFQVQTADDSAFSSGAATLNASSALVAASLTAGTKVSFRLPPKGVKRYIRAYFLTNASGESIKFSGGSYDAYIVKDVDVSING
jgi:hypothetical protein